MQQMYACPNCQTPVAYGQSICSKCGVTLDWGLQQATFSPYEHSDSQQLWGPQVYACPNCGAQVAYGQSICGNCRVTLDWRGIQQPPGRRNPKQHPQQKQNLYSKIIAMFQKKGSSGIVAYLVTLLVVLFVAVGIVFVLNVNPFATSPGNSPDGMTPASTTPSPKIPPAVTSFSADPSTITPGQETTLSWDVSGATSVSIDQDIGTVSSSGTRVISPATTITYHLTATNNTGPVTASATVMVNAPVVPVINNFTADKTSISAGESVALQWNISGANSASIDPVIGSVSSSGTQEISPTTTTTYILTASNNIGSVTKSVAITVAAAGVPVITSFTAAPVTIDDDEDATLSWDVSGATSVSINQNIGTVLASGSKTVSPATTTTYTLTARNNVGSATREVTITVSATTNLPVITFTASPGTIAAGASSTLSWSVTEADEVSIDQGIDVVDSSGTLPVSPETITTYTLTATNSYGSVTKSVTVRLSSTDPPVINSFTADKSSISAGETVRLTWSITGATSASIDYGVGGLTSHSGYVEVEPIVPTTYTLTAINNINDTETTQTVIVTVQ